MVDYDGENRMSYVWNYGEIYKWYLIKDYQILLFSHFFSNGLQLSAYIRDNDEHYLSDEWMLSEKWKKIPSDNTRFTEKKLMPFEDNSSFDLLPLHEAADEVISLIKELNL